MLSLKRNNLVADFKKNINILVQSNRLAEAKVLIDEFERIEKMDVEMFSIKAVIAIAEGNIEESENIILQGLKIDNDNFDLNFNLGYIYELKNQIDDALCMYNKAKSICKSSSHNNAVDQALKRLESLRESYGTSLVKSKQKIVFFSKGDDKFIWDIIHSLSKEYEVKKITVKNYKQIDEGMEWADICWFEWCDELIVYGSKLPIAAEKKIICRLHSYEAFTPFIKNINWSVVDKLIFVANHIKNFVLHQVKELDESKTVLIPNGIDVNKFTFKNKKKGFNISYVGYINYKKGPMLLLHAFKAIYDIDPRYKLYIAGDFQDPRYVLYFQQMIQEMGLNNNVFFEGWQKNVNKWLEDKHYIISTSVLEGHPVGIMESMAAGLKPIIHNFVGAKDIYPDKYLWNTLEECTNLILSETYRPIEYRQFIEKNYSLEKQIKLICSTINRLIKNNKYQINSCKKKKQ